jgi:hypothetical protein
MSWILGESTLGTAKITSTAVTAAILRKAQSCHRRTCMSASSIVFGT